MDSKIKKKNLCRGISLALGKGGLCRGPQERPSARILQKKIKNLCRGLCIWAQGKGQNSTYTLPGPRPKSFPPFLSRTPPPPPHPRTRAPARPSAVAARASWPRARPPAARAPGSAPSRPRSRARPHSAARSPALARAPSAARTLARRRARPGPRARPTSSRARPPPRFPAHRLFEDRGGGGRRRSSPVLRRGVYHRKVWHRFLLSIDIIHVVVVVLVA